MWNYRNLSFVVLASLIVAACQTAPQQTTSVNRVLGAPNLPNAPYTNILVVAAVPSRETARNVELGLSGELKAAKVEAYSFVRESSSTEPTEAAIQELIDHAGIDGVIVVSADLTGAAITERNEQVDIQVIPQGGSLLGFFRSDYKDVVHPNQAEGVDYTVNVALVADFYDVKSDKRIYSLETSTIHGQTTYAIITAQSKAIVKRLKEGGVIR